MVSVGSELLAFFLPYQILIQYS